LGGRKKRKSAANKWRKERKSNNDPVTQHLPDRPLSSRSSYFFCLSCIVAQIKQKEKEVRILILGLDNAGKTTVVKKLCGEPIDKVEPTVGFNIFTLEREGYRLDLWDVGGQTSIRAYWRNYFEQTDGVVWVVDSTDLHRLEQCRTELLGRVLQQERLAGASLLVLANKQDVQGALPVEQIAEVLQLEKICGATRHWSIRACSAVTGTGLIAGVDWMVRDVGSRIFMLS
jgi:ADP-ribosylation factor-like protein 2